MRFAAAGIAFLSAMATARADDLPTRAIDPDFEVAQREYRRGSELYEQSRYEEAIQSFEKANAARPRPAFDYNIARCYDRLGKWPEAVRFYERYLASPGTANDPGAATVRTRAAQLRARLSAPPKPAETPGSSPPSVVLTPSTVSSAPTAPTLAPETRSAPGRGKRVAGVVLAAAGVALAAAGIACGVLAQQASDDVTATARARGQYDAGRWSATPADQAAEAALFAVGGAALVAGVVVYAVGRRDARRVAVAVVPTPGGSAGWLRLEY
jgi:tetratricopeptide (TPR) repeat protein